MIVKREANASEYALVPVSGPPSNMMAVAMAMHRPDQMTPSRGGSSMIETSGNEKNQSAWPCSSPEKATM